MESIVKKFKKLFPIVLIALVAFYCNPLVAQTFQDSPSGEANGDFPSKWNLIQGSAEIAHYGEPIIYMANKSIITPKLGSTNYLSNNFTLEFDAYYDGGRKITLHQYYDVRFWDGNGRINLTDNYNFFMPLIIYQDGGRIEGRVNDKPANYNGYREEKKKAKDVWRHITISFNSGALKLFVDDFLAINIPHVEFEPSMISIGTRTDNYIDFIRGIKNVRITGINNNNSTNNDTSDNNTNEKVQVSTLAGSTEGFSDGQGFSAKFYFPHALATDSQGNVYVQDNWDHKIRKVTPNGAVNTFAGSSEGYANGSGSSAMFDLPYGLAIDKQGNVYVADSGNNKIRKITPNGEVSTIAGSSKGFANGSGSSAKFNNPYGLAIDEQDNLYVSDMGNHKIRKITSNGVVSTLAGSTIGFSNGSSSSAKFNNPSGVAVDGQGNVYVADFVNHKIRKINPNGEVTTLAGSSKGFIDASGTNAKFNYPNGITIDAQGTLYVADNGNHKIRKITSEGMVSTLVGMNSGFADGSKNQAKFSSPYGMAVDEQGNLYVADTGNHKIRKITQN
jgi:sugar lactone lactonase YvrE